MSLTPDQIAAITDAPDARARFEAVGGAAAAALGCALFTVMRYDAPANQVERLYSTNPGIYPVGGRKTKRDTTWTDHVLTQRRVFVGQGEADIRAAFDDHATILGLGLRSIINVPVEKDGRCVGTVNFLMPRETIDERDVAVARLLAELARAGFDAQHSSS